MGVLIGRTTPPFRRQSAGLLSSIVWRYVTTEQRHLADAAHYVVVDCPDFLLATTKTRISKIEPGFQYSCFCKTAQWFARALVLFPQARFFGKMEDDSVLRVSLEMNASEFCGQLNYSAFRDQLTMLIDTYSRYLKAGQEPKLLSDDSGVQHVIVLPAVSEIRGQRNALVMGFDQSRPANLRLKLMFVDAAQFMEKAS